MATEEHVHEHTHEDGHEHQHMSEDGWSYCEVHPDRETALRCNKCGRFMCAECAVQTPVGYRCKECVREQEDKFFSGTALDYIIIFGIALALSFVGGIIVVNFLRWFLLAIFVSAPIGGGIGEVALRATKRRRGRYSAQVATMGVVLGGIAFLLVNPISALIYIGVAGSAIYSRFQMRI
ncbi:MAG: hypothetical protein D6737_12980 [Chloroflexi bacterium]|nr:MAG: hypothetical protein D6737_12980 [Chloroflexota bacterium]